MKYRYLNYFLTCLLIVASFLACGQNAFAQKSKEKDKPVTIYGNVKSEQGFPLMGVEITVQDSFIDTETDELGNFEITIPKLGSVLVFRTDLYLEFSYAVNMPDFLQISLKEAPAGQGINDYVTMPWGVSQQRNLTSSIPTIGNEELSKSPIMSLGNALTGRLAGLDVKQVAGRPGYDEATLTIRGARTLIDGATNAMTVYGVRTPLLLVDGFERNFTELDASEIESISVLKDVGATAIYGMRGANGVIMVTTKRGVTNKRTIDLDISSGVVSPTILPDLVDSYTYATLYNEALKNDGKAPIYTESDLEHYRLGDSPLTHPNVDFFDEFMKKFAMQRKASLNMRGGNKLVRYFVALAYNSQDGLFKRTGENPDFKTNFSYNKYNMRSNIDVNITNWITLSADIAGRIEDRKSPFAEIADILSSFMTPPNAYPISFMGIDPDLKQERFMLGGNSNYKDNPLGQLSYKGYTEDTRRYYQATAKLDIDLSKYVTKGLGIEGRFFLDGYNMYTVDRSKNFSVWEYSLNPDGTEKYTNFALESSLTAEGSYNTQSYNGFDVRAKYNRTFGNHTVQGMLLFQRQTTEFRKTNLSDQKYENLGFWANYSYKNKYFLDVTGSYMSSDRYYDTNNRKFFYPAVGAAWVVSAEDFMKGSESWLDLFKIRASYGLSGNDGYTVKDINSDEERYPGRQRWWSHSDQQKFGTSLTTVLFVSEGRFENDDIKVETARMLNVGVDATMFNNRLNFAADYWREHRYNIFTVGLGSIPWVIGLLDNRLPIGNEGIVDSQGFEVQLGWQDRVGDFSYGLTGIVDWNDTKIINMAEPFRLYDNLIQTGKRTLQSYGWISEGLFKDWDDINNSPRQAFGDYQPGDIKYKDVNGDNIIDSNDMVPLGDGYFPRLNYSMDLYLSYKGFYVSALFQGVGLRHAYPSGATTRAFATNNNASVRALGRFRTFEDGTTNYETATYPRLSTTSNDNNLRASTYWFRDASFIRLKNAEIGYNFSHRALARTNISGARIYLNAYNALTFTKFEYLDPEDMSAGVSRYPQVKIFNLGVKLTF